MHPQMATVKLNTNNEMIGELTKLWPITNQMTRKKETREEGNIEMCTDIGYR